MQIGTYIPLTRTKPKFLDMIRMLDADGSTVAITIGTVASISDRPEAAVPSVPPSRT